MPMADIYQAVRIANIQDACPTAWMGRESVGGKFILRAPNRRERSVLDNDFYRESDHSLAGDDVVNACGMTDQGRVRKTNQDQFLIAQLNKSMRVSATSMSFDQRLYGIAQGEVMLVADGMGGHAAGDQASRLAIEHLVQRLLSSIHWHFHGEEERESEFVTNLQELLKEAHAHILSESAQHVDQRGMGTTLTMAYLIWPRLYVVHAGDSRCYLIRDGQADVLTTDHTLAHQLVEAGGLKPEDEASSRWSNVLWNVLGGRSDGGLIAEVRRVDLEAGDKIVLCSDGLHRYVKPNQLANIVNESQDPSQACQSLIKLANDAGGEDNITVIVSAPAGENINESTWIEALTE
ncbi:PP2C family protein-serine/threonine phosphatase [Rubripirellula reticaptiva]|nr:protein phosphatase 2C domain-containing protein [Rubripirellula reticaptiva]